MTPDEERRAEARARALRDWYRLQAARAEMDLAALNAAKAMRAFMQGWRDGERWAFEEHPDVQETVAQMRGFYSE